MHAGRTALIRRSPGVELHVGVTAVAAGSTNGTAEVIEATGACRVTESIDWFWRRGLAERVAVPEVLCEPFVCNSRILCCEGQAMNDDVRLAPGNPSAMLSKLRRRPDVLVGPIVVDTAQSYALHDRGAGFRRAPGRMDYCATEGPAFSGSPACTWA